MNEERSLKNIKVKYENLLNSIYEFEDLTNYDIEAVGKATDILQKIDLDKEFLKIENDISKYFKDKRSKIIFKFMKFFEENFGYEKDLFHNLAYNISQLEEEEDYLIYSDYFRGG
jgi:hypothetical protein